MQHSVLFTALYARCSIIYCFICKIQYFVLLYMCLYAGPQVPLPADRVYDGRDMSDVLMKADGKSKHEVLFFYGEDIH